MIPGTLMALLSLGVQSSVAVPLLGGIRATALNTVSGLTGTYLSGSGVTGSSSSTAATSSPAGTLAPVTNIAGPVLGAASGAVASAAPVVIGAAAPVVATTTSMTGAVTNALGLPALLQASCDVEFQKCTVTVSGGIENMLTDGKNFTGKASISAWMKDGHAYGSADATGTMASPVPFDIACDPATNQCIGSVAGNVRQVFENGQQVQLWGWVTPQGSCKQGVCTGSLLACGDPGYKAKRADLC